MDIALSLVRDFESFFSFASATVLSHLFAFALALQRTYGAVHDWMVLPSEPVPHSG